MNNASIDLIKKTIEMIENNIKSPMILDDLSKKLFLSKYYLHRIFKSLTGQALMSYVRGRRLTKSIDELLNTELNMLEIAYEYNFKYEQSYSRSFKQLFGISPKAFRLNPCELIIVPPIDTAFIHDVTGGIILEPKFCIRPQFNIAGIEKLIIHKDNYENVTASSLAMDFYYKYLKAIENKTDENIYYGLVTYSDNWEHGNYYMSSTEINKVYDAEMPIVIRSVQASSYAVFRYIGFHSPFDLTIRTLSDVYNYIENVWYPSTDHIRLTNYHFERIDLRLCSKNYCETDIFIPIK